MGTSSIFSSNNCSQQIINNNDLVNKANTVDKITTTIYAMLSILSIVAGVSLGACLAAACGLIAFSPVCFITIGVLLLLVVVISALHIYSKRLQTQIQKQRQIQQETLALPSLHYSCIYEHLLNNCFQFIASIDQVQRGELDLCCVQNPVLFFGVGQENRHSCVLMSVLGNISMPAVMPQGDRYPFSSILVNAANPKMERGGSGTNQAITSITSAYSWDMSRECQVCLQEGEITSGPFLDPNNLPSPAFTYLCQALGPRAANHKNCPHQCFRLALQTYQNILERAKDLGCNVVQLPLISTGVYAPTGDTNLKLEWINASRSALLQATLQFKELNPEYELLIVVINKDDLPIG